MKRKWEQKEHQLKVLTREVRKTAGDLGMIPHLLHNRMGAETLVLELALAKLSDQLFKACERCADYKNVACDVV